MQDFRNLRVWQASRRLNVVVYQLAKNFPVEERFGLASQIRRSATAITANIAEAFGRSTRPDVARGLQVSIAEGCETLSHLYVALDLGYINQSQFDEVEAMLGPIRRMLTVLLFRVKPGHGARRSAPGARPST